MLRRFPFVAALVLGVILAGCTIQDVPVDGMVDVVNVSVVYDGTPVQPEFEITPPGALVGVTITITPTGGEPLPAGTWPVDVGTYQVVVEAGPSVDGGRGEGTLTITPRPVTVAPRSAQAKLVGEADPDFAFDADGLVLDHVLVGALVREPGESVGTYAFGIGTLDAGTNYTVELAADAPVFTIAISVLGDEAITVTDATVEYDGSEHAVTIVFDPPEAGVGAVVAYGDLPSGTLPVDAGVYPVSVAAGSGYVGEADGTLTIEPRTAIVTPDADQGKTHGEADPEFTYVPTNLVDGDVLDGELARAAGESVGTYAFELGTLDAGTNYTVELAADAPVFTIAISVLGDEAITVTDATVEYDGSEHAVTIVFDPPEAGVGAVVAYGDLPSGTLPVDAGVYPVSVAAGSGYVGEADGTLTIEPRTAIVTPDADQGKTHGEADPEFTYVPTNLVDGDVLDGELARAAGESVGTYAFELGTLDAGANYVLELATEAPAFAITARPLTLTGFAVDPKVYDGTTDATGADFQDDRLDGDALTIDFDVAFASADVGAAIAVNFSNFALSGDDAGNYALATTSAAIAAAITPRPLTVTNVLWADKVYDGGTGATASATLVTDGVVVGDGVALAAQLVGSFASERVGDHAIVGSFQLVGADAANYVVQPQPIGSAAIGARPVSLLEPILAPKTFDGSTAAEVTGTLQPATGFDRGLLPADVARLGFAASFAQAGASADGVVVTVVLTGDASTDYVLDPAPELSAAIARAEVLVTPDAEQGKTYGDADGPLDYTPSGLVGADDLTGALGREAGEDVGSYAFELGSLDGGPNYTVALASGAPTFAIAQRPVELTSAATASVYGAAPDLTALLADGSTLRDGDILTGALARPDIDVGTNAFTVGSAAISREATDVSGNYAITFADYTLSARPLTVTAQDRSKTYGDVLELGTVAFDVAPAAEGTGLVGDEQITGVALTSSGAEASATVAGGPYPVLATDATGASGFDPVNYDITYLPGSLTVDPRPITLSGSFSVATKPYDGDAETGAVDPAGLVLNGLVEGDDVAIDAAATFGDALVADGKLATLTEGTTLIGADASNYALSLVDAPTTTGTLVKAEIAFGITIAGTDFATEVVYDGDRTYQPNVTTSLAPVPTDVPVAYYVEIVYDATGGSVGSFNPVGTYTVTVTADDPRYEGASSQVLEVLARPIVIAASVTGKDYGTEDPAMTPSLDEGTFGRNEAFVVDGALAYDPGAQEAPYAVGSYPLGLGTVTIVRGGQDVTANYAITFASDFEIEPATVTISPLVDQGKTYGDLDPVLTYLATGLLDGDALEGALGREAGEDVASYAFTLGDLDAGANYALVLEAEAPNFAIALRPLTLTTADPAFTYGDADLDLTAVLSDGSTLRDGDALTGALALSEAGAGEHAFLVGTVTLTRDEADVASNYDVAFAAYAMTARSAMVTPNADQGKTYGDLDPDFGYVADLLDGDELTGALGREAGEDVGAYAFTLGDLANPNYALELVVDAPTFAVGARAITLEATIARKDYSTPDPDLSPVLAEGSSLREGDALVGALAYVGVNVGSYPLEIGSVQVMRGDADVGGNYTITLGSFAIDPLPVAFDLTNADLVLDGDARTHVFFGDGSEPIRGLTVAVTPDGATPAFRFTYRWTHDADYVAFASPVTVQRIQGLGTYEVTVTATSTNHVGQTVLTVWVTDAIGVAFTEPSYEALVGASVPTQVQLIAADDSPRAAGPAPLVLDLASDAAHVAFATGEEPASSTTVTIASGATFADVDLVAMTLGAAPAGLTATVADASGPGLASGAATFATTARLVFAPAAIDIGAGATTDAVSVQLLGVEDAPVLAPADLQVDLTSDPADVVFRNAADDADVAFATIASGASQASFRMRSDAAGAYAIAGRYDGALAGIAGADATLDVTPRPVVSSIEPGSVAKAQTVDLVLTGTGFQAGVSVAFSGADVTVDSVTVDSDTQVTVRVTIAGTTAVGARSVTLDNLDGGSSTTEDALVLTVPTLTANDDGPFGVVEGGNRALSIATDLLANDGWTGTTAWGFDGVVSASGVTYGVAGDVLTVTAAADTGGSSASLTYRVRDTTFDTTATATVAIDVTLAPVDAILFTDPLEFDDFLTTEYSVPTFAEIFASWPRFNYGTYYADAGAWSGTTADLWYYTEDALGDRVVFPQNGGYDGIVSREAFEYYTHEATLYSSNSDDDSIGLIIAFSSGSGSIRYLIAHRTNAGNEPSTGWGLSYFNGSYVQPLVSATVPGFTTYRNGIGSGWAQSGASRVKVERSGDRVRLYATNWFTTDVGTATPAYAPESEIVVDLATGAITYYDGSGFRTVTSSAALDGLRGAQQYGYFVSSQADTSYLNIAFEGGAATDTAILLTGYDAGLAAYTGSEVWRFTDAWALVAGRTIQQELDFPRDVTSVAKPNPGSAYPGGYAVFGDRFRIEEAKVVPIID